MRYARLAPRKGRRVIDLVRGKDVGEALTLWKILPQHDYFNIEKVLRSAIANAKQKNIGDIDDLVVSQAYVDPGPALKRFKAGPMGRAMQRKKCMSHITMVLSPRAGKGK